MNPAEFVMTTSIDSEGYFCARLINNSQQKIDNFLFCFSVLSPIKSIDSCSLEKIIGGYCELAKSDNSSLLPGDEWTFKYAYEYSRHKPMNHTWGPQGGFLKLKNGNTINLKMIDLEFERISSVASAPSSLVDKSASELLRLVPHPHLWTPSAGVCNLSRPINVFFDDFDFISSAYQSVCDLGERLNLDLFSSDEKLHVVDATSIRLKFQKQTEASAYHITITSDEVEVIAGDETGFFYGLISLMQLDQMYHKLIPCGSIFDQPRFNWRGQHLDTVRHFYSVDSLLKLLDLMSLFKLNKFHWHGTDDEAFRFKLASNPDLATATSKRGSNLLVPPLFGSGPSPTGGCYDKNDIKRVIDRASANYIEVMPEFDLPGHNLSLIQFLPSMRDKNDTSNEISVQGYSENTLNPAMPETFSLVEPLIDDLCALFPGDYINLGGDEVPPESWTLSPEIDSLKEQHSLNNNKDITAWFINKLASRVELNNKKTAAWQEAEEGLHMDKKLDKLLFTWRDLESGHKLARQGNRVVLCPGEHLYFDMAQSKGYGDRGANWAAIISLEDTVDWEIVPSDEPELEKNIEGVQGHLWSETITEDRHMEAMLCPRIIGLSESAWTSASNKRKGSELNALSHNSFRALFKQIGWDYHRPEDFSDISGQDNINEEGLASEAVH